MAQHPNAKLTPRGRQILVERIAGGMPVAHVADQMGVSRQTAYRWWRRFQAEGTAGLVDRPCRPHTTPHRTDAAVERQVVRLRRRHNWGPAVIGHHLGLASSTCWRILARYGINRLTDLDPPTGQRIRRYEKDRPGQLIHVDIKKIGRIPDGGGWRAHGRGNAGPRQRVGYEFVHAAVDDHSRLAYAEVLTSESGQACAAFWRRAAAWFAEHDINVQAVMTDNAFAYTRSVAFAQALDDTGVTRHMRIKPRRPQTNGKVERFNQTLKREWAYTRLYTSTRQRTAALDTWLHWYNHHRYHHGTNTTPINRVNNAPACDS